MNKIVKNKVKTIEETTIYDDDYIACPKGYESKYDIYDYQTEFYSWTNQIEVIVLEHYKSLIHDDDINIASGQLLRRLHNQALSAYKFSISPVCANSFPELNRKNCKLVELTRFLVQYYNDEAKHFYEDGVMFYPNNKERYVEIPRWFIEVSKDLGELIEYLCRFIANKVQLDPLRLLANDDAEFKEARMKFEQLPKIKTNAWTLSEDGSSLTNGDLIFTFSPMQANCVLALWESFPAPLRVAELLEKSESVSNELRNLFKKGNKYHPAWKEVIEPIKDAKGMYRINPRYHPNGN